MVSKIDFLGKLPIFSQLYPEELEKLAQITDEYEFEKGAAIAYQRDIADRFYMVKSGRLFAQRVDNRGIVRETKSYLPGHYFEDIWLFTPTIHEMTVNAASDGTMYVIEEQKFLPFLIDNPEILDALELSEEARYEAEHTQAALPGREAKKLNLLTDEIVEFYERRTILLFIFQAFVPGVLALLLAAFAYIEFQAGLEFIPLIAAVAAGILSLVVLFLYIDWSNDYFVITNKHLVHNEYDLRNFQVKLNKVPIDQVQSVEILRPNLLQNLLNVGSARITTASRSGVLTFDFIREPKAVEETINKLRQRVQAMDAGRVQAAMRRSIEEHFDVPPAYEKVVDPDLIQRAARDSRIPLLRRIRRAVAARLEEGTTITYRKHVLILIWDAKRQLLAGTILLLGLLLLPVLWAAIASGILWILNFLWFVWVFEDWRNDTFQLTDRYVIDIDRQPFGTGESRKQAELGNVQNVNANRPGLLHTIFNFGNVNIETAGASADIVFEMVVNPSRVQSDIFQRREKFAQSQRIREGQQRRKEYAVFIDAYQQATEQNRLPERRSPFPEDFDDLEDDNFEEFGL